MARHAEFELELFSKAVGYALRLKGDAKLLCPMQSFGDQRQILMQRVMNDLRHNEWAVLEHVLFRLRGDKHFAEVTATLCGSDGNTCGNDDLFAPVPRRVSF